MKNSEQRTQTIIDEYRRHFKQAPTMLSVGPGRVNLIGEHTDYNDGFVLPVAIKRDIRIALRPRDDRPPARRPAGEGLFAGI
jgi:galactokinase